MAAVPRARRRPTPEPAATGRWRKASAVDGGSTIRPAASTSESATGSFVGFRIDEELQGIGSTTAVGRTGDVTGGITIEGTTVTAADFVIDLTTITTNDDRRDNSVQGSLDTERFPHRHLRP